MEYNKLENIPSFGYGTKIVTINGYKNIEDINTDDYVLTHNGSFQKVKTISSKYGDANLLKCQGFIETITGVGVHFYSQNNEPNSNICKGSYIGMPIITNEENTFNLTKEECWLLGRYVADGHYRKAKRTNRKESYYYSVIYSIGDNKVEEFKKRVKNRKFACYKHSKSTHRIAIYSMDLVNFIIEQNFGLGAENKRIPQFVFELPIDLATEFLNGYMSGDGSVIKNKIYQAGTISKELALGLCLLVAKCKNVNPTIGLHIPNKTKVIEGRIVNQSPYYTVRWRNEMTKRSRAFISNNIVWNPVRDKSDPFKTELFGLEVENANSYIANNMIVII